MGGSATRTVVLALGGNALSPSGEKSSIADQFRHTRESLGPVVQLAAEGWNICVVHGNGPQVGDELARNEIAREDVAPLPLGVLVGSTAGWIGYMIQQSVYNALQKAGSNRRVATVITQVVVDPEDAALASTTKFIGHPIAESHTDALVAQGQVIKRDGRGKLRRVVGSPAPVAIHELAIIKQLVAEGTIVIACGGGGIPVYRDSKLGLEGVDAVIDKDLAAAVLARELGAELFVILTDVDAVYLDWGTPTQRALDVLSVADAIQLDSTGAFGEGSMAPKVRAAVDYVRRTNGRAIITALDRGMDAVRGRAGTTIAG